MKKKAINKEYWKDDPTFMDEERFFDVPNWEGVYQISNYGNVKSFSKYSDGRILKPGLTSAGYLTINFCKNDSQKTQPIHKLQQVVFFNDTKKCMDHIDCVKTNNMLTNLRSASHGENNRNKTKQKNSTSKYLGVWYNKREKKWVAGIRLKGKGKHIGYFKIEKDAAIARDNAVKKYLHKTLEFIKLNFE